MIDLRTPQHLGGDYYLTAVGVGRDGAARTVRDCPVCGGHVYDDEWHLTAVVDDVSTGRRQRHHYCDDGCLAGLLRTAT